jgi:hypothetical protein
MSDVFWCWPMEWAKGLAKGVGFHKPTVGPATASSPRASSPGLDQGGIIETLVEGIWKSVEMASWPVTPQSRSDVVGSLRLRLQGPDHRRPDVVLPNNIGPAGQSPLGARRSRSCLRHSLRPSLGDGGRLTPTTGGARLSSLTSFLRALAVGGFAAVHLISDPYVAGRANGPFWAVSEPSEAGLT